MLVYRILFGIDLAAIAVLIVLTWPEFSREPFDSDSAEIYLPVVGTVAVLLGGGYALRRRNHLVFANVLLLLLAIPAVLLAIIAVAFTIDPTHR